MNDIGDYWVVHAVPCCDDCSLTIHSVMKATMRNMLRGDLPSKFFLCKSGLRSINNCVGMDILEWGIEGQIKTS